MGRQITLDDFYDHFPRVETSFQRRLDDSLNPRGPDSIWTEVERLNPRPGAVAVDVGCGEGKDSIELARRFGLRVCGVDPVQRHTELGAVAARQAGLDATVSFVAATSERMPLSNHSVDLIWSKEALMHTDLTKAFLEFRRVIRAGGAVFVYQVFTGLGMSDAEADGFWRESAGASSVRPEDLEQAADDAGLSLVAKTDYAGEWGEYFQERSGAAGRRLLHTARLLRDPQRYMAEFGEANYRIMLGDCLWHVYRMIGKLHGAAYTFVVGTQV